MRNTLPVLEVVLMLVSLFSPAARAQDADSGKKVFTQVCGICHDARPGSNRVGPSLFGVVGRTTGSVPGFHYSDANRNAHIAWNPATLDQYIANPRGIIPGTFMSYSGLKDDQKRHDLIAYLATLH
jgi:cytochrome c